ncbi:MAG: response regulator receiver protein [Acidobacteriaceae bacterium]|jgi:CheY-like chemotaxis protein|nr:response regulator receiver protein [Acidobacteriaceae bacterium]
MPANVTVLLVDDNPMIREMLRQSLANICTVAIANDGTDALLRCIENPPDLIVTDYSIPGLDGRQLLEKLKSRTGTAKIPLIMVASRADITEKLKMVQDSVEDYIEKPFFLKEAVSRIKKVVDKVALEKMAREAPGESTLRGSLAQMNIMDLFQSLEMGHKSCSLTLSNSGEKCQMFFSDGQINHAIFGASKGDEAVYKVMSWVDGTFSIDFTGSSAEQTTTRSTQGLLMEGLRLLDEANRDAEENVLEG